MTGRGRLHVAIPRAMMTYLPRIADPFMYLRRHLTRLAERFQEKPRLELGLHRRGD